MRPRVTLIIGCTGCGKGAVGRLLAERLGGEILSVDSMKVFRRMDIGTAKPSAEARQRVPHHLLDVAEPCEDFSVAQFAERAERAIADIHNRGRLVFAVGGTALYVKALTEGLFDGPSGDEELRARLHREAEATGRAPLHARLAAVDPVAADRIHPNDLRRITRALEVFELTGRPISQWQTQWNTRRTTHDWRFIGLMRDREDQSRRTNERVRRMIEAGLIEEVRALLAEPRPMSTTARQALGYAEIIEHLTGGLALADAVEKIKINTRKLSKAQRTWFKRFRDTRWFNVTTGDTAETVADRIMADRE
jgi:tRNA dimethylallyltransferase